MVDIVTLPRTADPHSGETTEATPICNPDGSYVGAGTSPAKTTTSATSSIPAAAADTLILAANTNRMPGSSIINDSTSIMYVLLGSGASATNYTVAIGGKDDVPGYYELPDGWTGTVHAYWVAATGNARITELSA